MAAAAPHAEVMGTRAEAAAATTADPVPLRDWTTSRVKLFKGGSKPVSNKPQKSAVFSEFCAVDCVYVNRPHSKTSKFRGGPVECRHRG